MHQMAPRLLENGLDFTKVPREGHNILTLSCDLTACWSVTNRSGHFRSIILILECCLSDNSQSGANSGLRITFESVSTCRGPSISFSLG